jgi:hypothetical protein
VIPHRVNPLAAQMLSEQVCRSFAMLAIAYDDGVVTVITSDPDDAAAREMAESVTGRPVRLVAAKAEDVEAAIDETFVLAPLAVPLPERIGGRLVASGLASHEQVVEALAEQRRRGGRLGDVLKARGIVSEEQIVAALAS